MWVNIEILLSNDFVESFDNLIMLAYLAFLSGPALSVIKVEVVYIGLALVCVQSVIVHNSTKGGCGIVIL